MKTTKTAKTRTAKQLSPADLARLYAEVERLHPPPTIVEKAPVGQADPADLETILRQIVEAAELDPQDRNKAGLHLARTASDLAYALLAKCNPRDSAGKPDYFLGWQHTDAARLYRLCCQTAMILSAPAGAGGPLTDDQRKRIAVIADGIADVLGKAEKPITAAVATKKYAISKSTIRAKIDSGEWPDLRPPGHKANAQHWVCESTVAREFQPR